MGTINNLTYERAKQFPSHHSDEGLKTSEDTDLLVLCVMDNKDIKTFCRIAETQQIARNTAHKLEYS
jgi:hypothetical protein